MAKNKNKDFFNEDGKIQEEYKPNIPSDPIEKRKDAITLSKYLTDFSKNHNIDNVIKFWHYKKEPKSATKSKSEWDIIIEDFFKQEDR